MQFYPNDWRADQELQMCSLSARGLWVELMCLAFPNGGQVLIGGKVPSVGEIAIAVRAKKPEVVRALVELSERGVASTADNGALVSRRMMRDARRREVNRQNGSHGGNPVLKGSFSDNRNDEIRITGSDNPPLVMVMDLDQQQSDLDLFGKFWKAYPRKVGKENAVRAFKKINPNADLVAAMLSALSWQTRSRQWVKDGGAFIPHPATYLNGRRWEDELEAVTRPRTLGPAYVAADWREECERLHGGACGNAHFHAAKVAS